MNEQDIQIRPLTTLSELVKIESLERQIWGMDDLELISSHTLHALVHSGGQVLGAFAGEQVVGFVVTILGVRAGTNGEDAPLLQLYSVIAGVAPAFQNRQIGMQLKLAQRAYALALGIPVIVWTYDPLESRNAWFNIAKLGAVCNQYHVNFHGEMSGINAGLKTDRFEVQWWVASERVQARLGGEKRPLLLKTAIDQGAVPLNQVERMQGGGIRPLPATLQFDSPQLLVEIPSDFQKMKQHSAPLAQQWRTHTQQLFTNCFAQGYAVTDFFTDGGGEACRSFYLLTR